MVNRAGYQHTEAGIIPGDWCSASLEQIVEFKNGKPYEKDVKSDGRYYLVTLDSIGIGGDLKAEHKRTDAWDDSLRKGDIVAVLSDIAHGGLLGLCDVIPEDNKYVLNQRMGRLRLKTQANPEFVRLQINRLHNHFRERGQGTSQRHIYQRDFDSLEIPLAPLPEQERIAAAISDCDALGRCLDQLIAKKRYLTQAAMQQLLTGRTRLPGFSDKWAAVEFGEIATIRDAKVLAAPLSVGTACVELECIASGSGRLAKIAAASEGSVKYAFKAGDVLFGRLRAYLRKYWFATFDGLCSTEIWPLLPLDARLSPRFLYLLVQTDSFAESASRSYGTHMPRTDWSVVSKVALLLPKRSEQAAIAEVIFDMDAEIAALETRRDKLKDLKVAMMQELLTGKIRLVASDLVHA